jgi:hypothetical protein
MNFQDVNTPTPEASSVLTLLTPRQAAAILNVPVQTLAIWRCRKRVGLNWVKIGRHIRYRLADLIRFIDENAHGAAA